MIELKYVDDIFEFYADYKDHMLKHYNEFAAQHEGNRVLNLDFNLYQKMIELGSANIFTVWYEDEFAGYVSVSIAPSLLFKGEVDAKIDHIYITEKHRGNGFSKQVIFEIENELFRKGVDFNHIGFPLTEVHENMAETLGYKPQACLYYKDLEE